MKPILLLVFLLVLVSPALAEQSYIFEKDQPADIRISCFDDNDLPCNSTTVCHLSVFEPDSDILVHNATMSRNQTHYNYTLSSTQTDDNGIYSAVVNCDGSTESYTSFTFEVTPNGTSLTDPLALTYTGLLFLLTILTALSITGIFKVNNVTGKYAFMGFSYLLMIALIFVAWNISSSFLPAEVGLTNMLFLTFRILLASALPFFILSFIFYLFEFRKLKQIQSLIEKGVPEDEAVKRSSGKW